MNNVFWQFLSNFIPNKQKRHAFRKKHFVSKTVAPPLSVPSNTYDHLNYINRLIQTNLSTFALHQKTFLPFKSIHLGQEIVILATGPSAQYYEPISHAIHIGVNRAFELRKALCNYYFIQDYSGKTPQYIEALNNYEPTKCTKFYGLTLEHDFSFNRTIPEIHALKAHALRYRTDWANLPTSWGNPEFTYDIAARPLGCFGSVVFPALQFALYTHPRKIYLVGCDCSTAGYACSNEKNFLVPQDIIRAYRFFKLFVEKYYPDIEIVSINPIGLKGIFKDEYTATYLAQQSNNASSEQNNA